MATFLESISPAGTVAFQFLNNEQVVLEIPTLATSGVKVVLKTANAGSAYTITNGTTDRTYDADATSTAELADVLYTLVQDLKVTGLIA